MAYMADLTTEGIMMSGIVDRFDKWRAEQQEQQAKAAGGGRKICLHCSNEFTEGVVTADAAICDVCNGD